MKFLAKYLTILSIVAGISLSIYYFVRIYFFFTVGYGPADWIFAGLLLVAETHMILQSFGYAVATFQLGKGKKLYGSLKLNKGKTPRVAVVIAARHEPKSVLEKTFITMNLMKYPNMKVYLLDGSDKIEFLDQDRKLCDRYGIEFFHPKKLRGSKASIINDFLLTVNDEYLAIFDADQNPMPDFLEKVVAIAEKNRKIAVVQTPQFYSNVKVGKIARGAAMQQAIFYEAICESKGTTNSMFFCGTNALVRRSALLEVGGLYEDSITEDFATSVHLHMKGYESVYYNHARVFGMAPESLPAYFKQQARWAAGCSGVLVNLFKYVFKYPHRLKISQWWEYFMSSSYYFGSWAFFILYLAPIIFLIFGIPTYFLSPEIYIATFVPYFVMTSMVFYVTMKKRNYGFREIYNGIIMSNLSFPVLMVATLKGLFKKKLKFNVTPKGKSDKMAFYELAPWTILIIIGITAIVFGVLNFISDESTRYSIAINTIWTAYHLFILLNIYKFNKLPDIPNNQ